MLTLHFKNRTCCLLAGVFSKSNNLDQSFSSLSLQDATAHNIIKLEFFVHGNLPDTWQNKIKILCCKGLAKWLQEQVVAI